VAEKHLELLCRDVLCQSRVLLHESLNAALRHRLVYGSVHLSVSVVTQSTDHFVGHI